MNGTPVEHLRQKPTEDVYKEGVRRYRARRSGPRSVRQCPRVSAPALLTCAFSTAPRPWPLIPRLQPLGEESIAAEWYALWMALSHVREVALIVRHADDTPNDCRGAERPSHN